MFLPTRARKIKAPGELSGHVFTRDEKYRAAMRELGKRAHVYPRQVAAGRMSKRHAEYQIAVMQAIAADYADPAPPAPADPADLPAQGELEIISEKQSTPDPWPGILQSVVAVGETRK